LLAPAERISPAPAITLSTAINLSHSLIKIEICNFINTINRLVKLSRKEIVERILPKKIDIKSVLRFAAKDSIQNTSDKLASLHYQFGQKKLLNSLPIPIWE